MVLFSIKYEICKVNFTDNIYNRRKLNCGMQTKVPRIGYSMNPAKLYKKKGPKEGKEKETRGKDHSPGKQVA